MSNIAILFDDKTQDGSYSGGAWDTGLSLANLKTYDPKQLARSDDDSEASTTFLLDFGYSALVDMVALVNHNLTDAAEARVRVGPNADGSAALIDATLTAGDFGSFVPAAGKALFHLNADPVYARYILWEISDESNPRGYVQIGRHIAGPVFQPSVNMTYGATLGVIDQSRLSRAVDGSQYSDLKPKRRIMTGAFDALSDAEGFGQVYDLQDLCGTTIPLLVVRDPSLTGNKLQRTSLYGTLVDMAQVTIARATASGAFSTWQFSIEERP